MPRHDSAEGSAGHDVNDQKPLLEKQHYRQHTAESSVAQPGYQFSAGIRSRESIFTPSKALAAHLSQSKGTGTHKPVHQVHKQALQLTQHRPTVLRRGHQPLHQDFSVLPTERPDAVPKSGSNQSSPCGADSSCQNKSPPTSLEAAGRKQGCPKQGPTSDSEGAPESSLFVKGICRWPGCNQTLKEPLKHLCSEHGPGDKGLAEWRDQRERVQYMEKQLALEKKRLQEMQFHLQISDHGDTAEDRGDGGTGDSLGVAQFKFPNGGIQGAMVTPTDLLTRGYLPFPASQLMPGVIPTIDYYKYNNIRPPYTYADMIRWAILESSEKQLALNEIYQWFMSMFHYFRINTATWKNAVRHNLSLHKCFVRVEGMKGSVWTVDDVEFMKRKGQKIHRNQDVNWMAPYSFFYTQH